MYDIGLPYPTTSATAANATAREGAAYAPEEIGLALSAAIASDSDPLCKLDVGSLPSWVVLGRLGAAQGAGLALLGGGGYFYTPTYDAATDVDQLVLGVGLSLGLWPSVYPYINSSSDSSMSKEQGGGSSGASSSSGAISDSLMTVVGAPGSVTGGSPPSFGGDFDAPYMHVMGWLMDDSVLDLVGGLNALGSGEESLSFKLRGTDASYSSSPTGMRADEYSAYAAARGPSSCTYSVGGCGGTGAAWAYLSLVDSRAHNDSSSGYGRSYSVVVDEAVFFSPYDIGSMYNLGQQGSGNGSGAGSGSGSGNISDNGSASNNKNGGNSGGGIARST